MGKPKDSAEKFLDVNVMGTQRLLEAALANEVERFVYISSTAIYCTDRAGIHPTPEDAPLDPLELYGASKTGTIALVFACASREKGRFPASRRRMKPTCSTGEIVSDDPSQEWVSPLFLPGSPETSVLP